MKNFNIILLKRQTLQTIFSDNGSKLWLDNNDRLRAFKDLYVYITEIKPRKHFRMVGDEIRPDGIYLPNVDIHFINSVMFLEDGKEHWLLLTREKINQFVFCDDNYGKYIDFDKLQDSSDIIKMKKLERKKNE